MYILLEDASWYNRYLVEDGEENGTPPKVEGGPPQGDNPTKVDGKTTDTQDGKPTAKSNDDGKKPDGNGDKKEEPDHD